MIAYNNDYILKNKFSSSYQNQIVNAIKLFFSTILNTKIEIDKIHRPKNAKCPAGKQLPVGYFLWKMFD